MANLIEALATIRDRIRRRCDQENSTFVSDTEINEEINASYAHLFDEIHDAADTEGILNFVDLTTSAGTDIYTITDAWDPGGEVAPQVEIYRVAGVDAQFNGKWRPLTKVAFPDRNDFVDATGWTGPGDTFYRLHNHVRTSGALQIRLFPVPQGTHTVRVWYMPIAPNASTTLGVVALNGWDEFIVADVCAKILEKEESSSSRLIERRNLALRRVIWAAANLDDSGTEGMREVIDWERGAVAHASEENSEWS